MVRGKEETHESYGMLRFSRFTGGNNIYFGSSIKHNGGISLTIKEGVIQRSLNNDWYCGGKTIVEIDLSPSQFAEAITNMNSGDGVPCTIKYAYGKRMEEPPFTNKRLQFENEFKTSFNDLINNLEQITDKTKQTLKNKKPLTVQEKQELINTLEQGRIFLQHNLPFIATQFNEQMDQTVKEAKAEADNFITQAINTLGLEKLNELKLLTNGESEAK